MVRTNNRNVNLFSRLFMLRCTPNEISSITSQSWMKELFSQGLEIINMYGRKLTSSITASSDRHWCDGRQHNLRFNYGLKTVLQLLLNILRPKITPTQQTGRRPLKLHLKDQGDMLFYYFYYYSPHFIHAVLCRSQHLSETQMCFKAQYVTRRTVCLMLCKVWCDYVWCVSNRSPSTTSRFDYWSVNT